MENIGTLKISRAWKFFKLDAMHQLQKYRLKYKVTVIEDYLIPLCIVRIYLLHWG